MEGMGGSDMTGWGAAVMATGKSDVTLNHAHIVSKEVVRNALFVGGNAMVHVNNSTIEAITASQNQTRRKMRSRRLIGASTYEAPWVLGLSGNLRATNIVDSSFVYSSMSCMKSDYII